MAPRRKHPTDETSFRGDTKEEEKSIEEIEDKEVYDNIAEEERRFKQAVHEANTVAQRTTHYKVSKSGVIPMAMLDAGDWGLNDSQEPYALPDGSEVRVRIVEVRKAQDKNGLDYLQPRLEVEDEPYAKDFTHFLHIPDKEKMSPKQLNRVRFNMKSFLACFEIDSSGPMSPEDDWPGQSGWVILGVQENDQYGQQNFIKQLITPR